ncbi:hypothetical protein BC828DRAFT_374684 [Blastocladiella britannica]|nr:hypothetical protein BC828DRAFT_374684 [Blastocladiella britannica]
MLATLARTIPRRSLAAGRFYSAAPPAAPQAAAVTLTVFKVQDCHLCDEAMHVAEVVQKKAAVPMDIRLVDIHDKSTNGKWLKYMMDVPVMHLNDRLWGMHRADPGKLLADVEAAHAESAANTTRTAAEEQSVEVPQSDKASAAATASL